MLSLCKCRALLLRTRWVRAMGVLSLLGVIAAGFPRWEMHSHSIQDAHHAHAAIHADHDVPLLPGDGEPLPGVLHVHDAAGSPAAPLRVHAVMLIDVPPAAWVLPQRSDQVAHAAGPPPDRPPIA